LEDDKPLVKIMVVRKPPYKKCWLDFQGYMDPIWDIHKWPAVFLNANSQPRRTRRSDSASFRNCNASETLVFRWAVDGIVLGAGFFFQWQIFWEISCLPTWRNDPFFEFWIFGMFTPTYLFLDFCFEFSPRKLGKWSVLSRQLKYVFGNFHPYLPWGNDRTHFDDHIFSDGLVDTTN